MTEVWQRGPVPGVDPVLMPAAHAIIQALEDAESVASGLGLDELWARPGGAASIGFHISHIAGVLDRLLTYARGEQLSEAQFEQLEREAEPGDPPGHAVELIGTLRQAADAALGQIRATPADALLETRYVGRARIPSNVIGLIFHAAEHAQRHTGQIIATAKIIGAAPDFATRPPIVCVIGRKNSGKTTLVVRLVAELSARGYRIMTVKHGHAFDFDRAGTDSWRHRHEGGSVRVAMVSPHEVSVVGAWGDGGEPPLGTVVDRYLPDADIVIAEGFKHGSMPVIEVHRSALHDAPLYTAISNPDYVALVTDAPVDAAFPVLASDDPDLAAALASLIIERFRNVLS